MKIQVSDLEEMKKFANKMAGYIKGGTVLALTGELGAGKTTFTKYFLKAAGVRSKVLSPTFVLMVPHKKGKVNYYHLDLYRTKSFRDIENLGIKDLWQNRNNITIMEWADKIKKHWPVNTLHLHFKVFGNGRVIEIK